MRDPLEFPNLLDSGSAHGFCFTFFPPSVRHSETTLADKMSINNKDTPSVRLQNNNQRGKFSESESTGARCWRSSWGRARGRGARRWRAAGSQVRGSARRRTNCIPFVHRRRVETTGTCQEKKKQTTQTSRKNKSCLFHRHDLFTFGK